VHGKWSLQHSLLKTALGEIEALRMKRQRQYADHSHPSLKRFTQQELNDEACPTYKNLLIGRSYRLPDRQMLLRISEYLECTSEERNDLLVAAGYLPLLSEITGRSLGLALEQAHQLMSQLPLPAMIVTPTLDIQEFNEPFRHLFDISRDIFYENRMNLIDFHFNSDLPVRSRSTFDAESFEHWESHAIYGMQSFKRNHLLSRHDYWYQSLIRKFHQYDDADKYWDMGPYHPESKENHARIILARTETAGELVPIRYRQTFLSVGRTMYPRIGVFLPDDEPARKVFADLGCIAEWKDVNPL
jgi:hypothetical protein